MTTPDFAAIIHDLIATHAEQGRFPGSRSILAAPIAAMCPDCKGTGRVKGMNHSPADLLFSCPSCPTIGGALTEWADLHQRAATPDFAAIIRVLRDETCECGIDHDADCTYVAAAEIVTEWADAHQRAATNGHTIGQAMKVYEAVMNWDEDDLDVTVAEQRLIAALRSVAR